MRVLSRENDEVDDGWLCDHGRFAYPELARGERNGARTDRVRIERRGSRRDREDMQRPCAEACSVGMRVTEPLLRDGGELRRVSWERALYETAAGLQTRRRARRPRWPAGGRPTRRAFCSHS